MVVRMRLQRFGQKHLPFYRIVVADARAPRDGKFIEIVGSYNPLPMKDNTKEIAANSERVRYWMSVGVQPSYRVAWLLGKAGILPPPPPRPINPDTYKIPKDILRKRKEEEKAARDAKLAANKAAQKAAADARAAARAAKNKARAEYRASKQSA